MVSRAATYSRLFRYLGAILFAVFVILALSPVVAFLVGGSAAATKVYNAIPFNPLLNPVAFLLPMAGIFVLVISVFFQSPVYKEAIGKIHVVTSTKSDNIGIVKFEGLKLRVKSDSTIAVGDYVKGDSTVVYNYAVNSGSAGAYQSGTIVSSRFLLVKKVDSDEANEIPQDKESVLGES